MFVCDAGPCGIFGGQLQVDNRFLAVARKFLALFAEETCITLNGNGLALAAYVNSTQCSAQGMEAIAVLAAVVLDFDVGSAQVNSCTVCCYNTGAMSCDSSLAVNGYVCTCAVSVDAGNVSPGGFTQSSGVLAFDNVINSPVFAVLSHGQIAMQLNFGIAVSVNAVNIVIAVSLNSGVAGNLYHSLLACALSIDADCTALANHRVTAAGLAAVGVVNIDIQSACSNACCAACNAVIDTTQRNSVVQNTCIFIRRNSLVVQSYFQLQSLVLSLDYQIFNTCGILYSCTADDEGACPIGICFLMSHLVNGYACILGEYIRQILLLYGTVNALLLAGDSIGKGSLFACARFNGFFFSVALTGIFIEFNGIKLHGLAAGGQAVSNLNRTGQVVFAVDKVAVGQLACQCIQYVGYAVLVVHSNAGVIGNQAYCGIFLCMLDNSVACCVVGCCFTVTGMSIEDIGIATVVINSQLIAVLLEDVACCAFTCATYEVGYTAALKVIGRLAPLFVVPGCTVLQPQISSTVKGQTTCSISITIVICYHAGEIGVCSGQAKVNCTFGTMNIAGISCTGRKNHITFDVYIIIICTGNRACFIAQNVHVDCAVLGSDSSIIHFLLRINNNAAALNINNSAAGVSKQAVSITLEVYITVYSNAATFSFAHTAGCINAGCTVIFGAAVMAFNIQLRIAVNNNVALAINANSIAIAISSNIQIAVNSQISIQLDKIDALQAFCIELFTAQLHF